MPPLQSPRHRTDSVAGASAVQRGGGALAAGRRSVGVWLVGGAVLLAGVGGLVWWKEREHLSRAASTTAPVELQVAAGGRPQTFPLADGSEVTLAPGSRLRSRGDFGAGARTLDLEGEALFNVAAGAAPFVVLAAGVRVEDVSTAFVVRALPATPDAPARALVAVTDGEVRVGAGEDAHRLLEGHAVLVDSSGAETALGADVVRGSVAWTSGALLFNDEPVPSVVERLQRWTGLTIAVDTVLRTHRLSLALEAESPTQAVQHVAQVLGARATVDAGRWTIRAK